MSSRTPEELISELDEDLAWRKKELSALRFVVETAPDGEQPFMIRAAIALVYAHWEGYIKDTADRYLNHVSMRSLHYSDLADHFAALGIRNEVRQLLQSGDPEDYIRAYREFVDRQTRPSSLPSDGVINTGSNLNYKRFRQILATVGIDSTPYDTREAMIDRRLLETRNNIAHGRRVEPDFEQYDELSSAVIDMLTAVRD